MMKFAAIAALVGTAAAAPLFAEERYASKWEEYKLTFNKNHSAAGEEATRYAIFKENVDLITSENKMGETDGRLYELGMTEYTDWSHEEFVSQKLSGAFKSEARNFNMDLLTETPEDLTVDWRTKGAVTPIKNQGQCGGCWAFSATGAMEGLEKISTGTLTSLSEQQLIDCSKAEGNQGCNGGLMDAGFEYVVKAGGMCTEAEYGFTGKNGVCHQKCKKVFQIKSHEDVPTNNEKALAAAVAKGPVSVAIEADKPAFQHYTKGILHGSACGTKLDHGVLTVGYGVYTGEETSDATYNFWAVKNSWGPTWGNKGFIYILKDGAGSKAGVCGIASQPSYPTGGSALQKYSEMEDVAPPSTPYN